MSRSISRAIPEEDRPRCVADCVDVLWKSEGGCRRTKGLDPVIDFLASNSMNIMLSDKEGCFVIMPDATFSEKATTAVLKNFRAVSDRPAKVKDSTIKFLHQLNLTSVAAGAKKGKSLTLDVFFAAKTISQESPFAP
ncbi:hypothetical protein HPB47_014041 [Ixodes persulcatus]|uniref:Uncharacterized protein n=1 Tax=Ixodes persulcatus TaxID=34615 RepID=A0AC60QXU8_IXOPE|nr:hypothetical protein HPB47_014041 [Ixodes persulcatus]